MHVCWRLEHAARRQTRLALIVFDAWFQTHVYWMHQTNNTPAPGPSLESLSCWPGRRQAGHSAAFYALLPTHFFLRQMKKIRWGRGDSSSKSNIQVFRPFPRRQTKDSDFRDDSSCVASAEADLQLPIFFERQSSQRGHLSTQCGEVAVADADR